MQLLLLGVAIEGDWMKVHKYMLDNFYFPNPDYFLEKYENDIDILYEKVAHKSVPSLIEQLLTKSATRVEIDTFFIDKLKIKTFKNQTEMTRFLEIIQQELFNELKGLCPANF